MRRTLSRRLGWAAGLTILAPWILPILGGVLGWEWLKPVFIVLAPLSFLVAPALAVAAVLASGLQRLSPGAVDVGDEALVVHRGRRSRAIPREQVVGGMLVPTGFRPRVDVFLEGGDALRAIVDDDAAGKALLEDLGVDPGARRVSTVLGEPARLALRSLGRAVAVVFVWLFVIAVAQGHAESTTGASLPGWVFVPWLASVVLSFVVWQAWRRPPRVTVGNDGVRVEDKRETKLIRVADIEDVAAHGRKLVISERGGRVTVVDPGGLIAEPGYQARSSDVLTALVHRIREAMEEAGPASSAAAVAERLDRGSRSIAEWRESLSRLLEPGQAYRGISVTVDALEAILRDASASAERRIGAALALRSRCVPDVIERIRVAADVTTDDKVRVALERTAEGDIEDAMIEEALAAGAEKRA